MSPLTVPYRYLIVDDDLFTSACIVKLLKKMRTLDTKTVENGKVAVKWLETTNIPPDIIICDLNMPELDGVEYMLHLSEKQFSGGVILISGTTPTMLDSVMRLATAHGVNVLGVLTKPIIADEIINLIAKFGEKKANQA